MDTQMPRIDKPCKLYLPHSVHIWTTSFLDGEVVYNCEGIKADSHKGGFLIDPLDEVQIEIKGIDY